MYNIVLVNPDIPQNTGNIGRLCVSTDSTLHLIEPLGFSLDEKAVKRAGLDYWQHLNLKVYSDWDDFLKKNKDAKLYFFSTKTNQVFWDCEYDKNSFLIFGSESKGLPEEFYKEYENQLYTIPMNGNHCRSLNLANSVAIVLFEGLRKERFNV